MRVRLEGFRDTIANNLLVKSGSLASYLKDNCIQLSGISPSLRMLMVSRSVPLGLILASFYGSPGWFHVGFQGGFFLWFFSVPGGFQDLGFGGSRVAVFVL